MYKKSEDRKCGEGGKCGINKPVGPIKHENIWFLIKLFKTIHVFLNQCDRNKYFDEVSQFQVAWFRCKIKITCFDKLK